MNKHHTKFEPSQGLVRTFRSAHNGTGIRGFLSWLSKEALDEKETERLIEFIWRSAATQIVRKLRRQIGVQSSLRLDNEHSPLDELAEHLKIENEFLPDLKRIISGRLGRVPIGKRNDIVDKIINEIKEVTDGKIIRIEDADIITIKTFLVIHLDGQVKATDK
jgi:hypothetical protein